MNRTWTSLLLLAGLLVAGLLLWRFLGRRPADDTALTNPRIERLEQQVDSLERLVSGRDSAIAAYTARLATLDSHLDTIAQRNSILLTDLNRRKRTIDYAISNDSLARDLNRILRTVQLSSAGATAARIR